LVALITDDGREDSVIAFLRVFMPDADDDTKTEIRGFLRYKVWEVEYPWDREMSLPSDNNAAVVSAASV